MNKILKIGLILIVTAGLLAGGYFAWRFFISPRDAQQPSDQTGDDETRRRVLTAISDESVFDYWINKKTNEIHYLNENGGIFKISPDGEAQETGSRATGNLSYIKPSADGSLLIVAFGYPQSPTFAIHDLARKTWQAMPAGTTAVAWDPQSNNRIAYLKDNGAVNRLYTFNLSDSRSTELLRFSQKDLDLEWVMPNVIYLKERSSALAPSSMWAYNISNRTIRTLIREENGLLLIWGVDGSQGLKWSDDSLTMVDNANRILASLNFKTLPSKCTKPDGDSFYCAAPSNQTTITRQFSDDYFKNKGSFRDDIYLIDVLVGRELRLLQILFWADLLTMPIDAERLEVFGDNLLFINRHDGKLYSLGI